MDPKFVKKKVIWNRPLMVKSKKQFALTDSISCVNLCGGNL